MILGKTNTPEFGLRPTTEPRLFGPTRNPWNPRLTPGGSSAAAAAAVAAGLVPMADANDGGGSIRIPASCCGLFGLKATRARNPLGPTFGDIMGGLVVEHAVTRSVRDSAALLDATAGPDIGDPYWAPPPARPFREEIGAEPGRLRIALSTEAPVGTPVHPSCVAAAEDAGGLCVELGHEVVEAAPGFDGKAMNDAFMLVWRSGAEETVIAASRSLGHEPSTDLFEPYTLAMAKAGRKYVATDYIHAIEIIQENARRIARFFEDHDVWLTPTLGEPPVPLGTFDDRAEAPAGEFARETIFVPFTPIANMTGQPAMSVPLHWSADGLPIGVHFTARFGDEATLFHLAAQLEAARPWANRRPPIAA